jgi:lysophospholipase L1-like esterase
MSIESTIDFAEETIPAVASPQARSTPRSLARSLITDLAILLLLALTAELALQLLAPIYGHDYYDRTLTASHPVSFNADGYRGPALPFAKAPNETRIIALGDSTTFGTGVGFEQTWPVQLRDLLAGSTTHPVSVMNVALQGESLADMTYGYDKVWSAYHPDIVTVMVSSNMISLAWIQRNRPPEMPPYITHPEAPSSLKEKIGHEIGHLCLPHFLSVNSQRALYWLGVMDHRLDDPSQPYGALLAHGWRQGNLPPNEAEEAWACFARELAGLKAAAAAHGAKLVDGFSPPRFDLSNSLFDNEKNVPLDRMTINPAQRFAQLCAAQNISCIDTLAVLRTARTQLTQERGRTASLYIMFDYNHLDFDGHAAVAKAMLPLLRDAVH